jgi:hypothetical protein
MVERPPPPETDRPIDFSFRPITYWPEQESLELLVSRIKGEQRRLRGEALLREGRIDELSELIDRGPLSDDLSDHDREEWGRLHPSNLGGEYLPEMDEGEVEIARGAIASTTGDVQSVRARRAPGGIRVQVVDEYENEFSTGVRVYAQPLTLRELIDFIDGSDIQGEDGPEGGLVLGIVRAWYGYDPDRPERLLTAAWASSAFYPDLGRYYEGAIRSLVSELTASSPPGSRT